MNQPENSLNKVQFHLGADWNIKISKMIDGAMRSYMSGQPMSWFYNMKGVKFLINSYLSEKEIEELDSKENDILLNQKDTSKLIRLVEDYDLLIKKHLKGYGFLNPFKDDSTSLF